MPTPAALASHYDPVLVAFSFAIAIAASYTALDITGRAPSREAAVSRHWMVAGAFTMGLGIWSMHFIGMTAFHVGIPVGYDVAITGASLLSSIVGSGVALWTVSRDSLSWKRWLGGTVFLGSTLGAMHYLGMAALRMQAYVTYDPFWFAMSGAIAMGASGLALALAFRVRGESLAIWSVRKFASALVLGVAIAGMHYAGMAAASFIPAVCAPPTLPVFDMSHMGIAAIACGTLFVLAGSLVSAYKASLQSKQADLDAIMTLNAELVATSERLRLSEDRSRQLADAMPQMVWTAGPEGAVDYVNRRWIEYIGLSPAESAGWGWQQVVHPDDLPMCLARWHASLQAGRSYEVEYRLRRSDDGAWRWHLGRAFPAFDAEGRITRWFGTCTDIHESKAMAEELQQVHAQLVTHHERVEQEVASRTRELAEREEALRQANEALRSADRYKDEFLSVISHELRTPLNFITGFASILADEGAGPLNARQNDFIGKILNGADRMLLLVNDLLDFAKLQSGKFDLSPVSTSYAPLVGEALALMVPLAAQKGLDLLAEHDHDVSLPVDAGRVTQVLTNLLSNAIKFADAGQIHVRTHIRGEVLVTEVSDQGCGIAAEHLPRLFQRFGQIDTGNTRRYGGTGLGLAICKALVEAHGGEIGITSELDVGTTVWFTLSLTPAAAPTRQIVDLKAPRTHAEDVR